jgi:hypothetical protein
VFDVGRIGGIIYGDWYLSQKADGLHLGRYLDFFYFVKSTKHVNKQWIKMWKKSIPTLAGSEIWNSVIRFNKLFPGYEKYEIPDTHVYPAMRDWSPQITDKFSGKIYKDDKLLNAVIKNKKANISFSLEEQERGQRVLEELKIPKDKDYICFHARDAAYLDAVNNNLDWNYHNFRDSSIQNYVLAAEEMTNRAHPNSTIATICHFFCSQNIVLNAGITKIMIIPIKIIINCIKISCVPCMKTYVIFILRNFKLF